MVAQRPINEVHLARAAADMARAAAADNVFSRRDSKIATWGPLWVAQTLYNHPFKDQHDILHGLVREAIQKRDGAPALARWDALAKQTFTARDDAVHAAELEKCLAITPTGEHKEGCVGSVVVGQRYMGHRPTEVETPWSAQMRRHLGLDKSHRRTHMPLRPWHWDIYAGEAEERERPGGGVADPFPPDAGRAMSALVLNWSIEAAEAGLNAINALLDEGSSNGILRFYDNSHDYGTGQYQPDDPNVTITGSVLLGTLALSATAFGSASDGAPGATATANTVTQDSSADADGTLQFGRAFSSNDGATPLNAHVDGNGGTTGTAGTDEAFKFNTLSVVMAAVLSLSSLTDSLSQGSTAS